MLRTSVLGGHVPLWRGPLQLQPETTDKPRQSIIDIVQQSESTPGVTTFLYEIRRQKHYIPYRGTSFVAKSPEKEKLKRIELKIIHNNENLKSHSFPVLETNTTKKNARNINRADERQVNSHQQIHESIKRTEEKLVYDRKCRPTYVRFNIEQSKPQEASGLSSPHESKSSSKRTELSCEVRGNAIGVEKDKSRTSSPSHVRAADALRRQNSFQSSLQLFRRRLKLNQEKFIQASKTHENYEDYLICKSKPDGQQTVIYPSPPQEPRQMAPQSSRPRLRVKYPQQIRKQHQNVVETCDPAAKILYKLPDSKDDNKTVGMLERNKTPLANVKTYVLEDNHKMLETKTDNVLPLTMHNLAVHQTHLSKPEDKMIIGNAEITCSPRFAHWLRESNSRVVLQQQKSVTFKVSGKKEGHTDSCGERTLSVRSRVSSDHGL